MQRTYAIEELKSLAYFYQGQVRDFEEAAKALGQGAAPDTEKARVINKMLGRGDSKFRIHGQQKPNHDQKVIEAVYTEIAMEDTLEALEEMKVEKSEEQREMHAEKNGDEIFAMKTLTLTDITHADKLENHLKLKAIRYQRVMTGDMHPMFILQNISETDISKINGVLGRIEMGEKVDAAFQTGVGALATGTKGAVQAAGKVTEGALNVVTATGIQLGKSLADVGAGAFVTARRESKKQKQALAMSPEALETGLAIKQGMTSLKAKLGFGNKKERAGWS